LDPANDENVKIVRYMLYNKYTHEETLVVHWLLLVRLWTSLITTM